MKKTLLAAAAVAALSMSVSTVHAQDKVQGSGPSPFTECGIGGALFPDTAWAAVTSNVIWDVGTTALTSATMSPETCNGKKGEVAEFILETYDNVVEETAIGEGEYVATMLNIYGCEAEQHNAIIATVRSEFANELADEAYNTLQPLAKAESYYNTLIQVVDQQFAASCAA